MPETLKCPLCGGTALRRIEADAPPFAVYACVRCDLGFVYPLPTAEALVRAYGDAYYEPWQAQHVRARGRMWQRRVRLLRRLVPQGRLLDVGGGEGAFVAAAAKAGYQVEATEFSPSGAERIRRQAPAATVYAGELVDLSLPATHYDAVTAWHSLEHMRDPLATLREIRRILRPNGMLVAAVPNRRNLPMAALYRLIRGRPYPLFSLKTKEIHLYHFTPASLRLALEQSGFAVETIGWDRSMVEPAKRVIDVVAAIPYLLGGPLMTEAILVVARPGATS